MNACWISDLSIALMRREADAKFPMETGGVLLGYRTPSGLVVMQIVGPGPNAIHRATSFIPNHEYQEAEIARFYKASRRLWTYLGDWHTHPFDSLPTLSRRDVETLKTISRSRQARARKPLMAILGGEPGSWDFKVWQLTTNVFFRAQPTELNVQSWVSQDLDSRA